MASEGGEYTIMSLKAMMGAFIKMKTMMEELYRRDQGGAEMSVKYEG